MSYVSEVRQDVDGAMHVYKVFSTDDATVKGKPMIRPIDCTSSGVRTRQKLKCLILPQKS